jgi:hypothetical protein
VKEIDVPRDARGDEQLVQRGAAGDVALAESEARAG